MIKPRVLFLCSGNSCRTQIAEAFLRDMAGDRFDIFSAGVEPTPLDPEAVEAVDELGIDISGQTPKDVRCFTGQRFTCVISLCDRAARAPDRRAAVRQVRNQLRLRIVQFISEHQ